MEKNGKIKRWSYIDALRGYAIFVVVYHHMRLFCCSINNESIIDYIMTSTFLPLFFFISGFVGFKPLENFTGKSYMSTMGGVISMIRGKTMSLLIPTMLFFTISGFHFGWNPWHWFCGGTMAGYWFCFTLFELFVVYYLIKCITYRIHREWLYLLTFALLVLTFAAFFYIVMPYPLGTWLNSNRYLYMGFPYFFVGLLAARYKILFLKLIENKFVIWGLLVSLFICEFIHPLHFTVKSFCYVLLTYGLFHHYRDFFEKKSRMSQLLPTLGRYSITIYFVHYWFLFTMPSRVSDYINYVDTASCFVSIGGSQSFVEFWIIAPLAIIISYFCVLVKKLFSYVPYLNCLLFGDKWM